MIGSKKPRTSELRITEKRMQNSRFQQNEEAFLLQSAKKDYDDTVKFLRDAGVSRSTFYFHHKNYYSILKDGKKFVLVKYGKLMNKIMRRQYVSIKNLFEISLDFVVQNKTMFVLFLKKNDREVLRKMIKRLRGRLMVKMKLGEQEDEIFDLYLVVVVEMIEKWEKGGFRENEKAVLVEKMVHFAETAKERFEYNKKSPGEGDFY